MIVYLWTAIGRRSYECGVSGSLATAQEAAEACLKPGARQQHGSSRRGLAHPR